jgi:hypothetical protein
MGKLNDYTRGEKEISEIPYKESYLACKRNLSPDKLEKMVCAINKKLEETVDRSGQRISVSSWIPGHDWTGTPFAPIYDDVCGQDYEESAMFFGKLVMDVVLQRCNELGENWCCMSECTLSRGTPISGKVYWQAKGG